MSLGAAIENMYIAAAAMDIHVEVEDISHAELSRNKDAYACRLSFSTGAKREHDPALVEAIKNRRTTRMPAPSTQLSPEHASRFLDLVNNNEMGTRLSLLTGDEERRSLGAIVGGLERFRMLSGDLHREMMSNIRWTRSEAERTGDGLFVDDLCLNPIERDRFQLLSSPDVIEILRSAGVGYGLEHSPQSRIVEAAAMGLVSASASSTSNIFSAGRTIQRLWLEATRMRLAFQPFSNAPDIFGRLRADPATFTATERAALSDLHARYAELLPYDDGGPHIFLFRVANMPDGHPSAATSFRRPLTEVLSIQD